MRTLSTLFQKKNWMKGLLGLAVCLTVFAINGLTAFAAEGKVTADTAKIRKEASTDSEVIGSTSKGKTVDIVGGVKDASGTVWYKVPNGNNTYGYIRSDLIETSDEIKISESASTGSSSSSNEEKPADTVPTAIGEQKATVTESSIRVRSGASTKHDTVTSLPQGTEMTLIGEANDSAGNKWYQMTCEYNGRTVNGYVRSDLIEIGEPVEGGEAEGGEGEAAEGENAEGEAAEGENEEGGEEAPEENTEPEHNDYEIVYNNDEYWLYINTNGTMMKVTDVLNVVETANTTYEDMQDQIKSNKIIIVILAVIIVLLVVAVTILIFKLRDFYYEDYYEDEEEEEEPVVVKKKGKRMDVSEEEAPARKKRQTEAASEERISQKAVRSTASEKPVRTRNEQAELQAAEKKVPAKKPAARKAQNFLLDDDEFEFEFLNMDDKDL